MHRDARQPAGDLLQRLRARRGRAAGHHHRRPRARRAARSHPGGVRRARRPPVRILHARHGDELPRALAAQRAPVGSGSAPGGFRQPVPLRDVSEGVRGGARGGRREGRFRAGDRWIRRYGRWSGPRPAARSAFRQREPRQGHHDRGHDVDGEERRGRRGGPTGRGGRPRGGGTPGGAQDPRGRAPTLGRPRKSLGAPATATTCGSRACSTRPWCARPMRMRASATWT